MKKWIKRSVWSLVGIGAILLVVRAYRGTPTLVDAATVARGPLLVTVDDDGRTRVRERYIVSAPIGGRLLRTALRPGDGVRARDTLVAEFAPTAPDLLDARSRAEAHARLKRAEAALSEAQAREALAEADRVYAVAELERTRDLAQKGVKPREVLERAERDERRSQAALRAAQFAVQVGHYELELARASLLETNPVEPEPDPAEVASGANGDSGWGPVGADGKLLLRSPIDGTVLRVFEESARTLAAGTPILEVGSTRALEIVADYLSQDAVKIRPGLDVFIEGWGGELPGGEERVLRGRVRVVEPGGFTKVSALGVEEQRVDVVIDPVGEEDEWAALGDGYRVEVRVLLWREDDALIVPTGALFREGDAWRVFVDEEGRARRRAVEIGRRNGLEAQVLGGLEEGERVVLYPSDLIGEGSRVEAR